nr:translation initiation factor IF-2-like [Taeniopygia guttata]
MPGALGAGAAPSLAVTAGPSGAAPGAPRSARGSAPSPRRRSAWPRRGCAPPALSGLQAPAGASRVPTFATWACSPKEGVVQLGGGKRGGEVGRRGTGAAEGSPACGQAQRDPPLAGTARGNAAGAPGGVTGGRPRGWPRPAGRHWWPAPRAAPRRQRGRSFDSALAARSPGPPSTWGRFYAFVPTLLPPVCLPRVAGCPAASRSPRRAEPRAAAAFPERRSARTGGSAGQVRGEPPRGSPVCPQGPPRRFCGRSFGDRAGLGPRGSGRTAVSAVRAHAGGGPGAAAARELRGAARLPRAGAPGRPGRGSRLLVAGIYTDMKHYDGMPQRPSEEPGQSPPRSRAGAPLTGQRPGPHGPAALPNHPRGVRAGRSRSWGVGQA